MHILIADDDITSREVLEMVVKRWGHQVTGAADGGLAWEAVLKQPPPDAVILDWNMPIMDGPALCRRIRELNGKKDCLIIMLTGRSGDEARQEALNAGADLVLTKPLNVRLLQQCLASPALRNIPSLSTRAAD